MPDRRAFGSSIHRPARRSGVAARGRRPADSTCLTGRRYPGGIRCTIVDDWNESVSEMPEPDEQLARARELRGRGEVAEALEVYARLIDTSPDSESAEQARDEMAGILNDEPGAAEVSGTAGSRTDPSRRLRFRALGYAGPVLKFLALASLMLATVGAVVAVGGPGAGGLIASAACAAAALVFGTLSILTAAVQKLAEEVRGLRERGDVGE